MNNRCINILNGDSAAGGFLQAFPDKRQDILVFRDVLSCGPLYPFNNLKQWQYERLTYWEQLSQENGSAIDVHTAKNRDFYEKFLKIEQPIQYRIWLGMGLSDQLLLSFLVFLFDRFKIDFKYLTVVQLSGFLGTKLKWPMVGLGLLRPGEILQHPKPLQLSQEQQSYALTAWQAFSSSRPKDYLQFMALKEQPLPLLHQAMSFIKLRYPDINNGLSVWDRLLLEKAQLYGPKATQILGHTMADETLVLDPVGDWYLYNRLINMAKDQLNQPLLIMKSPDMEMRKAEFELSEFGQLVLSNKTNVIKENGIDDWIGGVRQCSHQYWLRDGAQLVLSTS